MTPQRPTFGTTAAASTAVLMGLLLLPTSAQYLSNRGSGRFLRTLVAESRGRHVVPGLAFRDTTMAGYYENLLHGSAEPDGWSLVDWLWTGEKWSPTRKRVDIYKHQGYLLWEPRSSLNEIITQEGPVVTNSRGLFTREFPLQKSPGTRRIALFGDSLARGYGVPMEQRFDTLLERRLNQEANAAAVQHFEIINFAVTAYRPTQMYDVALTKASLFHPDVYIMTLTELGVSQKLGRSFGGTDQPGNRSEIRFLACGIGQSQPSPGRATFSRTDETGAVPLASLA